ncbi:4-alpha-glucanotransferase [Sphingomonas aracearum]|uniref:4-alpha-glucanotransferase n=1 Tax=Sphingomonas aracearum TaxID=2283317 RepID=A0A369VY41_9SPHN|nr:4-alpha-glucanotransferase [Sphingomonas aracearum]RDE04751.1 4-alpha-glucanotransferase [Sphingomonas aracearum]
MSGLHDLAAAAGLHIDWEDALGEAQRVSDEALTTVLGALGYPADSAAAIADSQARLAREAAECSFVSADIGQPVSLPPGCAQAGTADLVLEDGRRRTVTISGGSLPGIDTPGYHRLVLDTSELRLAVAPPRCFRVEDAAPGKRIWGPAVQIAALRDDRASAFGDFGTLADSARAFAGCGADALAISPVHALFPADASRYSPYAPSSRLFLNVLYGDPALAGLALPDEPAPDLINWADAIPARLRTLRAAYDARGDTVRAGVAAYAQKGGDELVRHARFDALHAHFFAASGATGWQNWPAEFHDPAGNAVAAFAAQNEDEVGFYLFLQWLARQSLDAAQRAATDGGMALGLIADLAVGMDGGGSHAWSRPDDLLTGLSIGAPPDLLGPDGQNWGITGFSPQALRRTAFEPFISTVRAALDHAGGIRIDHALGLHRLWVVPHGASASEGAYLSMPQDDLLRILAIESQRSRAVVIGEDLGTVPEGFRPAMDARAMLGMRVLWFERDEDGVPIPPADWDAEAAAMTGTHDLPTVAGYWQGRDIDWTWALGRTSRATDEAADRETRAEDRTRLWQAFTAGRVTDAPEPAPEDTAPVVDAALAFVAATPSALAIVPLEDVVGLVEQPNLPGTIDEHPNWRRRMPDTTAALLARAPVAARLDLIRTERTR